MSISLNNFINESELSLIRGFFYSLYKRVPDPFYLRNDILLAFGEYKKNSGKTKNNLSCDRFLQRIQELLIIDKRIVFVYRPRLASSKIYSLSNSLSEIQEVSVLNYLRMKERIIKPELPFNHRTMQLNFSPFFEKGTHIKDPDQIGKGITHLNRYLSSYLFQNPDKWKEAIYEFLSNYNFQKTSLLVNSQIVQNQYDLEKNLEYAVDFLERKDCCDQPEQPDPAQELKGVNHKLNSLGFLAGWGDNLFRILESMRLLKQVLEQPDENIIEEFMSRIPMISCIAVISPHGWFGQSKVMGRPDTGGQVVYILDQVKALEKYIINDLKCSGIEVEPKIIIITRLIPENEGTTSNIRKERVLNTQNSWIIRVPFKDNSGNIVPGWISRFHVWPYLDQFAVDSMHEVCSELSGKPDLIIGNYSDGNLVATLMANALGSIQCNIAHALEKTKYLFSDLYWEGFEEKYRFSLQFMADLISMNQASIIISSTAHEIKGTDSTIGQYESYRFFSLPGLMQVTNGINLFHHKFNIIPPGVNNEVFYPYNDHDKRLIRQTEELTTFIFKQNHHDIHGHLENPDLPPILTISRLDRIKNITGLVEAYGKSQELQKQANLIIIASTLFQEQSRDEEEAAEISRMYSLMDEYRLEGRVRWLGIRLSAADAGEVYRIAADRGGAFVQPALFEAFGLTVLEAMHSGLPVFATRFGGPMEIIEDSKDGFLINPSDQQGMVQIITDFFQAVNQDYNHWKRISDKAVEKAQNKYNWNSYCKKLVRLAKVYSFWKFYESKDLNNNQMSHYCDLLYNLYFKPRASLDRTGEF